MRILQRHRQLPIAILGVLVVLATPATAWAHAFGIRYDLPLPLWLYLGGAGAAVALSFAIMAVFLRDRGNDVEDVSFNLLSVPFLGWLASPVLLNLIRLLSVSVFFLLLTAGLLGHPDPFRNIAPTFIWVIWWVGMAFVSVLAGNLWDLLNPWKIIYTWVAWAMGVSQSGGTLPRTYPTWLGR